MREDEQSSSFDIFSQPLIMRRSLHLQKKGPFLLQVSEDKLKL